MEKSTNRILSKFIEWQKAILIFSSILAAIFFTIFIIFGPFAFPLIGAEPMTLIEIIQLCISGWVGWLGVGTIINLVVSSVKLLIGKSAKK